MRRIHPLLTAAVTAAVVGLLVVVSAGPAGAGGSSLRFERTEYLPGDVAHASGTLSRADAPGSGWIDGGPYYAYVIESNRYIQLSEAAQQWPFVPAEATRVGEVRVLPGPDQPTRVFALDVVVPQLARGRYALLICNEPCTTSLGDYTGGELAVNAPGAPPLVPALAADARATTPPPGSVAQSAPTESGAASAAPASARTGLPRTADDRGPTWWLWATIATVLTVSGGAWLVLRHRSGHGVLRSGIASG